MNRNIFVLLLLALGVSAYAQGTAGSNAYEVIAPYYQCKSPEAAAFRKYGEYQVSEYTGSPNISVPLYTIDYKDIQIPIVLTYDASGIKVEQEASWVGLGWNLMAGGCINYVSQGDVDPRQLASTPEKWENFASYGEREDSIYQFSWQTPYKLGNQYFHPGVGTVFQAYEYLVEDLYNGYGETDYFSANFLGQSFMFMYDRYTNQYRIIGKSSDVYKIEVVNSCNYQNIDDAKWKITDGHGVQYYFVKGEQTERYGFQSLYTSTWLLESIITPEGAEVSFGYNGESPTPMGVAPYEVMNFAEKLSAASGYYPESGYCSVPVSKNRVSPKYLSSITTPYETISFVLGTREDMTRGKRLDKIVVKSTITNQTIRECKLNYSYFTSSTVGGDLLTNKRGSASYTDKLGKRLKLTSVDETCGTETLRTSFEYNNTQLPLKTSAAQDFWGYFNNQENYVNNHLTLLPTPKYLMSDNDIYLSTSVRQYKGANRYCDATSMQAAVLQKIIYPTKGYTKFVYEPHQFISWQKYPTATVMANPSSTNMNYSLEDFGWDMGLGDDYDPHNYERISLNQNTAGTIDIQFYGNIPALRSNNAYVRIAPVAPTSGSVLTYTIDGATSNQNSYLIAKSLSLNAGTYDITVFCPNIGSGNYVTASVNLTKGSVINSIPYSTGGGLRIKRIEHYDNNNALLDSIGYRYTNEQGRSTGLLLQPLRFLEKTNMYVSDYNLNINVEYRVLSIKSRLSAMPAFAAAISGGVVGYSSVTKKIYNARGNNLRTIISTYRNSEPEEFWGKYFYYREADNGELISQVVKDGNENILMMTQNTYASSVSTFGHILLKELKLLEVGEDNGNATSAYPYQYEFYHFPFRYTWNKLTKTTTTEYGSNNSTVVKTKNYLYNTTNHQVSQIEENTGLSNQTRRTKITYSADGTDPGSLSMKGVHILNSVVETKNILVTNGQEKCISTQHTYYNGSCYMPDSYATSIGSNALETRANYSYDTKKNIRSIKVDGVETVYIWSYKGQYPIAKIEGLTYNTVKTAIGESTINSLLNKEEPSSSDISTMRTKINAVGGHITTYTYNPLVGMTSQTLPNGHKTTYDYKNGRLDKVSDPLGVMQKYQYNYK